VPASFYSSWKVTGADIPERRVPMTSNYCRDVSYGGMMRLLATDYNAVIDRLPTPTAEIYGAAVQWGWHVWINNRLNDLRFENESVQAITLPRIPVGSAFATYEWMRDHSVPLIISKLVRKFPTIEFSQGVYPHELTGRDMPTIKMRGDYHVPYAFYFSIYLQRLAMTEGPGGYLSPTQKRYDWKDANTLVKRRGDTEHLAMWEALRIGDNTDSIASKMLQHKVGPLSVFRRVSWINWIDTQEELESRISRYRTIDALRPVFAEYQGAPSAGNQ